ncbi:hypothetical protein [Halomonas elongata]|uniref:hypothetical protein n=1 Tax=Halomonas elongata TaxID=2746 RepID=UPI0040331F24
MLDEIICHIGMHKTGSSSIQATLNGYDDGEVFYVNLGEANHGIGVYTLFSDKFLSYKFWTRRGYGEEKIRGIRSAYEKKLKSELGKDRKTAIVSGEDISWLSSSDTKKMVSFFGEYANKITVVCYLRDPISFVASSLQERIKIGIKEIPDKVNPQYKFRLQKFLNTTPCVKLVVRRFERDSLVGGSVVDDFLSLSGVSVEEVEEVNRNSTLSLSALQLLYLFNRTCPVFFGDEILLRARKRLIKELRQKFKGGEKAKREDVSGLVFLDDLPFVKDNFDIEYEDLVINGCNADEERGKGEVFEELSDEADKGLSDILKKYNIHGKFSTPESRINRLYMHFVSIESQRSK